MESLLVGLKIKAHTPNSEFKFEGSETHGFLIGTRGFLLRSYDLESERREPTPPNQKPMRFRTFESGVWGSYTFKINNIFFIGWLLYKKVYYNNII